MATAGKHLPFTAPRQAGSSSRTLLHAATPTVSSAMVTCKEKLARLRHQLEVNHLAHLDGSGRGD